MAHTPQVGMYQEERQITDPQVDLNADVVALAGVNRLRVEAVIAAGGIFDEDIDDDSIAAGQTLLLLINENYQFDGAVWRRLQSAGAVAAQAYAPQRTLVDAVIRGDGGATWEAVAARNLDTNADLNEALIGLTVNARIGALSPGGAFARLSLDAPVSADGALFFAPNALYTNSVIFGKDTTGATVTRVPEARNYDTSNDVAAALIGLLVNSRLAIPDSGSLAWFLSAGSRETPSGETSFAGFVEGRESGYHSSNRGRRFVVAGPTAGAELTAQAAFVATTPTLMIRQAAGATETLIIRSIRIVSGTATPTSMKAVVMTDTADRFSAGGTARTPANWNEGSAAASGISSFLENATATAAGGTERLLVNEISAANIAGGITLNFKDEIILSTVGTLLIYVFDEAGAAAPGIAYSVEWEEYV